MLNVLELASILVATLSRSGGRPPGRRASRARAAVPRWPGAGALVWPSRACTGSSYHGSSSSSRAPPSPCCGVSGGRALAALSGSSAGRLLVLGILAGGVGLLSPGSPSFRGPRARTWSVASSSMDRRAAGRDLHPQPAGATPGRGAGVVPDGNAGTAGALLRGPGPAARLRGPLPRLVLRRLRQGGHARLRLAAGQRRAPDLARAGVPARLGLAAQDYSGLCADLASRGYVVVALSHPYESAVSVLADGRVVGTIAGASVFGANMADMTPIRAADSRFVLDQLSRLAQVEPGSPLVGHLDVGHTGIVGHSMGGAAAAQVVAEDPRFLVGVNLDGTLPAALAAGWHLGVPFLWLQSDGQQQASYLRSATDSSPGCPVAKCWSWAAPATRASPICPPTCPHWGGDSRATTARRPWSRRLLAT